MNDVAAYGAGSGVVPALAVGLVIAIEDRDTGSTLRNAVAAGLICGGAFYFALCFFVGFFFLPIAFVFLSFAAGVGISVLSAVVVWKISRLWAPGRPTASANSVASSGGLDP
ncbi:hypothetical protein [Bauldia sp.]|uniref:hypothetical protein n=1 Tax=Bauldia sp. TaxID=2575872 RepID=UPI003BA851FE